MADSSDIANRTVQHLLDINEGNCSITLESIEAEKDENIKYILTGLLYLHQDNVLMKEELKEKEDARNEYEKQLLEQKQQLIDKSHFLEESRDELATINKELTQFAYITSHDLKAPLRSIHTLANFIEEDLEQKNYKDVIDHISTLKSRVNRMYNLINGILDFSKIGSDKVRFEEIDLDQLAKEVIESINRPEGFTVTVKTKLPTLRGVRVHMVQLFSNLISNGIKYNNKSNGAIEIDYWVEEEGHLFSFKDNGEGIEKQYFEKIFVIFQTLNARDAIESTGIGLSIVKKIVDNLKGSIEVNSVVNEGTEFLVRIPRKSPSL